MSLEILFALFFDFTVVSFLQSGYIVLFERITLRIIIFTSEIIKYPIVPNFSV